MPGKKLCSALTLILALSSSAVWAEDGETSEVPQVGKDPEPPAMDFLEFLGEWETQEGQWIDPEELDQIEIPEEEEPRLKEHDR